MTPEEKKLNRYYLKKFNWTLEEVNKMFAKQGNVCAACGRPPGERRLNLDHDHAFDRVRIQIDKIPREIAEHPWPYLASAKDPNGEFYTVYAITRKIAKENVRKLLRRRSVRAGLCFLCNSGVQKFEDSKAPLPPSERLIRLARILEKFKICPSFRSLSDKPNPGEVHEENPHHPIPTDTASCALPSGNQAN